MELWGQGIVDHRSLGPSTVEMTATLVAWPAHEHQASSVWYTCAKAASNSAWNGRSRR